MIRRKAGRTTTWTTSSTTDDYEFSIGQRVACIVGAKFRPVENGIIAVS
jgi:hypothetical protein